MDWLLLGGVKSITNLRLSLCWTLNKWQRDMIQWPLLFTIGSSYDWIHLRVTGIKARLVTSDHAMKAHNSIYWSEKDLQKFVVHFSDIWWHLQEAISPVLYTPTAFPMDSDGLLSDPAISNGSSGQSIGLPLESVGIHQKWLNSTASPAKVQWKSAQAT